MPKRKRFRNRRGYKRRRQIRVNVENTSPHVEGIATPCHETSFQESGVTSITSTSSSPKPGTPSPRSVIEETPLNNELCLDIPLIMETPKRKSWNRERKSNYGSFNMTNLNVLFNSDFINNTPKSESNLTVKKNSVLQRSKSSIPKLQSPAKENVAVSHKGTQTLDMDLYIKPINPITETPKYSAVLLQQNISAHKSFGFIKKQDSFNKNEIRSEKLSRFLEKGVNINPYLKNNDIIDGKNKNGSFGEISFFSPHLFQHKSSSTPIEKLLNKAIDFDDHIGLGDLNVSKREFQNGLIDNSFGTPKLNTNLNVNNGISPDKVSDCF